MKTTRPYPYYLQYTSNKLLCCVYCFLSRNSGSGSPLEEQSQEIIPNSVWDTTAVVKTILNVCCLRHEIYALVACTGLEINVSIPEIRKGKGNWRRDGSGSHVVLEKWQVRPKWPSSHLAPPHMKVGSNHFCLTTVINSCPRVFVDHYSCELLPGLSPSPYFFVPICPSILLLILSPVLLTELCPFVSTNIPLYHGCPFKKAVLQLGGQ